MAPLYFLLNASHTRALSPSIPHLASNREAIITSRFKIYNKLVFRIGD